MRLLPFAVMLAFIGGCDCRRSDSSAHAGGGGAHTKALAQQSKARHYWLRKADVFDTSGKQTVRKIDAPVEIELLTSRRVRSVASPAFEGTLPPVTLSDPSEKSGLALYAQREAELHLGSPTGPIIGRIHPGAFVGVVPADTGYVRIALPSFRAEAGSEKAIVAFVQADALGVEHRALKAPKLPGRIVEDYHPNITLWTTRDLQSAFAQTLCGDIHVLSTAASSTLIAQYHAGVELNGWLEHKIDIKRGAIPCNQRLVLRDGGKLILTGTGTTAADRIEIQQLPPNYVQNGPNASQALMERIQRARSIFLLTRSRDSHSGESASCHEWAFSSARRSAANTNLVEARLTRRLPTSWGGEIGFPYFRVEYQHTSGRSQPTITLIGPYSSGPSQKQAASTTSLDTVSRYECHRAYRFIAASESAFRMLEAGSAGEDHELVAWHPDEEEHWFRTADACENAKRAALPILQGGSRGAPGGFHVICNDQLRE